MVRTSDVSVFCRENEWALDRMLAKNGFSDSTRQDAIQDFYVQCLEQGVLDKAVAMESYDSMCMRVAHRAAIQHIRWETHNYNGVSWQYEPFVDGFHSHTPPPDREIEAREYREQLMSRYDLGPELDHWMWDDEGHTRNGGPNGYGYKKVIKALNRYRSVVNGSPQ